MIRKQASSLIMELSDNYVITVENSSLYRKLLKLPLTAICDLALRWSSSHGCKHPHEDVKATTERWKKKKVQRKIAASTVLLQYWPDGLNLLQLAQLDCYLLFHKPNSYVWMSQTAYNKNNEKVNLSIDPDSFISGIKNDLGKLYMSHLYFCKHPEFQMVVCRIQLFDYNNEFLSLTEVSSHEDDRSYPEITPDFGASIRKELVTRAPFYICFPLNSPVVIHTVGTDLYAKLILESVQKCIFGREKLTLVPNEDAPIKNLKTLNILHGTSRYAHSLGPWSAYAESDIELSPLTDLKAHELVCGRSILCKTSEFTKEALMEKTMIKFKGRSYKGHFHRASEAKRRFDKMIYRSANTSEKGNSSSFNSNYASLIPATNVEFILKDEITAQENVTIKFTFQGNDIFGGLHELCDRDLIDLEKVPGWLAGENGPDSGLIENGHFTKAYTKGRLI